MGLEVRARADEATLTPQSLCSAKRLEYAFRAGGFPDCFGRTLDPGELLMSGTAELKNVVKVSEAGPSRKRISIEIPKETVTATLGTSLDMLVDQAEISGFRKGRAPKRLVEKRFGSAIMDQARQSLVSTAYQAAIEEHKIRPIGNPTAKDLEKVELAAGKVFAFELEVEVLPGRASGQRAW
jgi:hypothetical protein